MKIHLSDAIAVGMFVAAPCLNDYRAVLTLSVSGGLAWVFARLAEIVNEV